MSYCNEHHTNNCIECAIKDLGEIIKNELVKLPRDISKAIDSFKSIGRKKMNLKHFNMLGMEVEDKVTGFKGVATSISYDLYGCIQFIVTPKADKDGKLDNGKWFDSNRLKVTGKAPVMVVPNFTEGPVANGEKGGFGKPLQ